MCQAAVKADYVFSMRLTSLSASGDCPENVTCSFDPAPPELFLRLCLQSTGQPCMSGSCDLFEKLIELNQERLDFEVEGSWPVSYTKSEVSHECC